MGISERKEQIVHAVVDNYISNCTPISSSEIKNNYLPDCSSATIRNELASLEDMGYLSQPHTSAGRVPTAQAYKLYVDKLMPKQKLSSSDIKIINNYFDKKVTEIDKLLQNTAKVISEITNLTSLAVKENIEEDEIKSIQIIKISNSSALVVVVTKLNVYKDAVVEIAEDASEAYCGVASNIATTSFAGHTIKEVINSNDLIMEITQEYEAMFAKIVEVLRNYTNDNDNVMFEGKLKMLQQPEYSNVQKAKAMLDTLEAKEKLTAVLHEQVGNISININEDVNDHALPECAIVTTSLNVGGKSVGKAGVIGPIRMDYSKILSVLNYINSITNVFDKEDK